MSMNKYITGYMDKKQKLSKRTIKIAEVESDIIFWFNITQNHPRQLEIGHVLAAKSVAQYV